MGEAIARIKWPRGLLPALLFGALPVGLVLWDWASDADLVARLWTMPLPAAVLIAVAVVAVLTAGLPPLLAISSLGKAGILCGRSSVGLYLYAILATSLFATNPMFGLLKLGEIALFSGLALTLAVLFLAYPEERRPALRALLLGTTLALPVLFVLRASGSLDHLAALMLPGFVHVRILGFALALALVGGLGLWSDAGGRERGVIVVCLTLLWTTLFWSGGRGAFLAVIVGSSLSAMLLPAIRSALLPLIGTALAGFAVSQGLSTESGSFGLTQRLESAVGASSADALSSGRLEMWSAIFRESLGNPLFGHGYAEARPVFLEAGFPVAHLHAHNIVLDATLALGLVLGTVAALVAFLAAILGTQRAAAAGDSLSAAGVAIVWTFLAHALVDGIYFYAQGLMPLALAVALLLSARR